MTSLFRSYFFSTKSELLGFAMGGGGGGGGGVSGLCVLCDVMESIILQLDSYDLYLTEHKTNKSQKSAAV